MNQNHSPIGSNQLLLCPKCGSSDVKSAPLQPSTVILAVIMAGVAFLFGGGFGMMYRRSHGVGGGITYGDIVTVLITVVVFMGIIVAGRKSGLNTACEACGLRFKKKDGLASTESPPTSTGGATEDRLYEARTVSANILGFGIVASFLSLLSLIPLKSVFMILNFLFGPLALGLAIGALVKAKKFKSAISDQSIPISILRRVDLAVWLAYGCLLLLGVFLLRLMMLMSS